LSLIQHRLREYLRLAPLLQEVHYVKLFFHLFFASLEHIMLFEFRYFSSPLSQAHTLTYVVNHVAESVVEPPSVNQIDEDLSDITLI
jgi:hypothetical protein